MLGDLGEQVVAVAPGESFSAVGFPVRTFGGQHALIHPTVPVITNVAFLVGDAVYHPGDSLIVPTAPVRVLLAPIHAPWSKVAEVIDFVVAVRAPQVYQVHDALLNENGIGFVEAHVTRIGAQHGSAYTHLEPTESVPV